MDTLTLTELNDRLNKMTERDKTHFRQALTLLIRCYGDDAEGHALVMYSEDDSHVAEVVTVNCNDMDAARMTNILADFFNAINTQDAPPKEQFN